MEARNERRLLKLQRDLATVKLLIVDELGYVPLSPTGAELLFEVFSQATSAARPLSPPTCRSRTRRRCWGPSG
jgi:DNA replication protein DnaC